MPDRMKKAERYSRGTAYHEAGHAVVAWSCDLHVGPISISAEDASGKARISPADRLMLIEQIAVCAAGYEAENVFGHHHENPHAAGLDRNRIRELLEDRGVAEGVTKRCGFDRRARNVPASTCKRTGKR